MRTDVFQPPKTRADVSPHGDELRFQQRNPLCQADVSLPLEPCNLQSLRPREHARGADTGYCFRQSNCNLDVSLEAV